MAGPSFIVFYKDKMTLRSHLKCIPKVVFDFHLNQGIHFPVFFPKPHSSQKKIKLFTLDIIRIYPLSGSDKSLQKLSQTVSNVCDRFKSYLVHIQRLSK